MLVFSVRRMYIARCCVIIKGCYLISFGAYNETLKTSLCSFLNLWPTNIFMQLSRHLSNITFNL